MENKEILKIWEKGKQQFTPGHRTCNGCFIPTIVRTVLGCVPDGYESVVACATGCLEVTSTIWPHTSWGCSYIHNAFENTAATISGVESAYKALQKEKKQKKKYKFIAFGGDGGTIDIGLQSLSGALERGHDFLYILYDNEAYSNCLALSSLIQTKDGLKKIIDLKLNDEIYVFNMKTHDLDTKKISGIFDNGTQEIFEIITNHHNLKATVNHPFLVVKRNGRGKKVELVWRAVGQLKQKDEVVILKEISSGKSYKFKQIKTSKKEIIK